MNVSSILNEEGLIEKVSASIESGVMGGVPAPGIATGAAYNPDAILKQPDMFDFYDGGGMTTHASDLRRSTCTATSMFRDLQERCRARRIHQYHAGSQEHMLHGYIHSRKKRYTHRGRKAEYRQGQGRTSSSGSTSTTSPSPAKTRWTSGNST